METTRIERAIEEMDADADDCEEGCDDIRLAWLADQLHAQPAGTRDGFDSLWVDR